MTAAATQRLVFRLPRPGWPSVVVETDYLYDVADLVVDGEVVLASQSREELLRGVSVCRDDGTLTLRLIESDGHSRLELRDDGREALPDSVIHVRPTRPVWMHAWIAFGGSLAGFVASAMYLRKSAMLHSEWAWKMGQHTAAWHLLLTLTLFPAAVWGPRLAVRIVQGVSLLFFLIHASMAIGNLGPSDPTNPNDPAIALFNALSGLLFLAAAIYGNRAHRDKDPGEALRAGRAEVT